MVCIDWDDDEPISIGGIQNDDNYQILDIVLVPCNYIHSQLGYTEDSVATECVPDLNEQINYIGPSKWTLLMNHERINPDKFDEESIERFSLMKVQ